MRQINVGLLGLGTVGGGVAAHFEKGKAKTFGVNLKKIAVSSLKKKRDIKTPITTNVSEILNDPEIDIVVELIGGTTTAKDYIVKALENKKSIVTANKAVIAKFAKELFPLARRQKVDLAFEASVGGGIPIIEIIKGLRGERINKIMGILNGTTNYILTKMGQGASFEVALKDAQEKGFAEQNHILDTGGFDARDKISILSMLAYNVYVNPEDIFCEGITHVEQVDFDFASRYGEFEGDTAYVIKLLGISEIVNDKLYLSVNPTLIKKTHPLANIENEFNAVFLEGELAGSQLHSGKGAGRNATASAVFSDILRVAENIRSNRTDDLPIFDSSIKLGDFNTLEKPGYIRMNLLDKVGSGAEAFSILARHKLSVGNSLQSHKFAKVIKGNTFVPDINTIFKVSQNSLEKALLDLEKSKKVNGKPIFMRFGN